MTQHLETTPPLSEEGYARTFATLVAITTEYTAMSKIARQVITDNDFDKKPVRMLSIGAGTGHFEQELVKELGLKLEYIFAIEPNKKHVVELETALKSLEVKYDISKSFFNKEFKFDEEGEPGVQVTQFDLILFSHCLYVFDDPYEVVMHATNFLEPSGKIIMFNQGDPSGAELFTYLENKSDPSIFPAGKTINNHSLTAGKIISHFRTNSPDLPISVLEEASHINMDSFIRKTGGPGNDHVVSFLLQAEYGDLSREAQDRIYEIAAEQCELIDGKYWRRHPCVGIVLSPRVCSADN